MAAATLPTPRLFRAHTSSRRPLATRCMAEGGASPAAALQVRGAARRCRCRQPPPARPRLCCLCSSRRHVPCCGLQERTMMQRLGQSFNSAGIALFARVATVRGGGLAPPQVGTPAAVPPLLCLGCMRATRSLRRVQHSPAFIRSLAVHARTRPTSAGRATARWHCRTCLCRTSGGSTGRRCARRDSRAVSLTKTTRSQVRPCAHFGAWHLSGHR